MDPQWLAERAAGFDRRRASDSQAIHPWSGLAPKESKDTTHLSVVDGEGGIVALTTTLNGLFGCGLRVAGAGFFLNNEMDDFATVVGRPNLYGLVQGEANAVAPGRRMLSSQSPTVAWRGEEVLAIGGRGGSKIPSATLQVLLNVWVDGDDLQAALDRPRIHHQWLPDQITVEADALSPETRAELERRGHKVVLIGSIAQVHAVRWLGDGKVEAAAEPRGRGGAAGVLHPLH
jgi:gamma-glutamyltranspeptidase/glutathione hydrolase